MLLRWMCSTPESPWHERTVASTSAAPTLRLSGVSYQRIAGFGGCFNELGWEALAVLSQAQRHAVLQALFGADGCGLTLGRVPIGASDYARSWYSLNETDGDLAMEQFSLARDHEALIPYIRMAQGVQPNLSLFASPWSPPTWMKSPRAYNYGRLRWEPAILSAYARYLLLFVQHYQAAGLPVRQLHVQNEPDSDQKFPSCCWSGSQLRDFIRDYLGPLFRQSGVPCAIWAGTFERGDYDAWANVILSDDQARSFIAGVGYQWAGKEAVQRTHASWPELPIMQTENECGDGTNAWAYAQYVFTLIHHYLSNGTGAYCYWNMVLAPGGESTWGWRQNSMVTVDPHTAAVTYNPEFYVIRHLAHFVAPGAERLGLRGPLTGNALAFRNPDGRVLIVVANPLPSARTLILPEGHAAELPPHSFNTVVFDAL